MHSGKFTKIVATIGPSTANEKPIKELILSGTNFFRFNLKHETVDWHLAQIKKVKEVGHRLGVKVGIIVDLQGPETVIVLSDSKQIQVSNGDILRISSSGKSNVTFKPDEVISSLDNGNILLVDDGKVELEVVKDKSGLSLQVNKGGLLKSGTGVSFKSGEIKTSTFQKSELESIKKFLNVTPDFFALSFVRDRKDIEFLKNFLKENSFGAGIIAKIETKQALDDLAGIIEASDAIMVARGDLGVEVPVEKITFFQKKTIDLCREYFRPVIVATQMLESMTTNLYPTRAEVSDISNAVRDGADAAMLSGETAIGKYPVETVKTMHKIVSFNEKAFKTSTAPELGGDRTFSIVKAATEIIKSDNGKTISKILVATETGRTARIFSSFRPDIPIIALSQNEVTLRKLGLSYGVLAFKIKFPEHGFVDITDITRELKQQKILTTGENVIVVHGRRWQDPGNTNSLYIFNVN